MILLIGSQNDPTILHFKNFLQESDVSYFFLNQNFLFNQKIDLCDKYLMHDDRKYYYKDFSGALNRLIPPDNNAIKEENADTLLNIYNLLSYIMSYKIRNILNLNHNSISNNSKLFQLNLLSRYIKYIKIPRFTVLKGLNIRNALSSASPTSSHVVKSLSAIRSIVKVFETNQDIFSAHESSEPVLFQEFIKGVNVRAHIVGGHIVAIKISSSKVDYRYEEGNKLELVKLPEEIEKECFAIAQNLNLKFAGIDLLLTSKNKYYILEVNPSPGYSYFEKEVKSKVISQKLLEVLLS